MNDINFHVRKILKSGAVSKCVAVPQDIIDLLGMEKGSTVYLFLNDNLEIEISLKRQYARSIKKKFNYAGKNPRLVLPKKYLLTAEIESYVMIKTRNENTIIIKKI